MFCSTYPVPLPLMPISYYLPICSSTLASLLFSNVPACSYTELLYLQCHLPGMVSQHISTYLAALYCLYPAEPILFFCLNFLEDTYYLKVYSLLLFYVSSDTETNITQLQRYLPSLFTEACQNFPFKWRASFCTVIPYHLKNRHNPCRTVWIWGKL